MPSDHFEREVMLAYLEQDADDLSVEFEKVHDEIREALAESFPEMRHGQLLVELASGTSAVRPSIAELRSFSTTHHEPIKSLRVNLRLSRQTLLLVAMIPGFGWASAYIWVHIESTSAIEADGVITRVRKAQGIRATEYERREQEWESQLNDEPSRTVGMRLDAFLDAMRGRASRTGQWIKRHKVLAILGTILVTIVATVLAEIVVAKMSIKP